MNRIHTLVAITALLAGLSACNAVPQVVTNYIEQTPASPAAPTPSSVPGGSTSPNACPSGTPMQLDSVGGWGCVTPTPESTPCPTGQNRIQTDAVGGSGCVELQPAAAPPAPSPCPDGQQTSGPCGPTG